MRRVKMLLVVILGLAALFGCASNASEIILAEAKPREVKPEKTGIARSDSLRNFFEIGETIEMWACFGSPDEYTVEKDAKAVIIYNYHNQPSFEVLKKLKKATEGRSVIYFTEKVSENEKSRLVIRETGSGCKHYLFRSADSSAEEIARMLDGLRKRN